MKNNYYELPALPFEKNALAPFLSEEQLGVHYEKHHQAYVNGANSLIKKLDEARENNAETDIKAIAKELSFQIGGFVLHSVYWENLAPAGEGGEPAGDLDKLIKEQFGSFERFKDEFSKAALTVEGSGWAALAYCLQTERLIIIQIEKHNSNIIPNFDIIMVLDMFEHAYYIDYKNDKAKYVAGFWDNVNWKAVAKRLEWLRGL